MTDATLRVAAQFETACQQLRADLAGMWVFLATELLFFGGLFLAYAVYRASYPDAFAAAAGQLKLWLGGINTAVLLSSSMAMSLADPAMEARNRGRARLVIGIALLLGLAFLALKGYEYRLDFAEGTAPFAGFDFRYDGPHPDQAKIFFGFYFALTGLHALHMIVGVGLLALLLVLVGRWRDPERLSRPVRIIGLYWAFVDIVWTFIYPALYLLHR